MSSRGNVDATLFGLISHDGWQVRQGWWQDSRTLSQMGMLKAWETSSFYPWGWNGLLPTVDQAQEGSLIHAWNPFDWAPHWQIEPWFISGSYKNHHFKGSCHWCLQAGRHERSAALCLCVCISSTNKGTKSIKDPPCTWECGLIACKPDPNDLCRPVQSCIVDNI